MNAEILKINDDSEVCLDPNHLKFNETTLNNYIQTEAGFYDNFGAYLALAEEVLQTREMEYERLFTERFTEAKDHGGSDKYAEAKAKSDPDVIEKRKECIDCRYNVKRIQNHLKAWDKNHDNAQSLGHMLRKEMDKLNSDIYFQHRGNITPADHELDRKINDVIKPFSPEDYDSLGIETLDLNDL